MIQKRLKPLATAVVAAMMSASAHAETATFTGTTAGCPNCVSTDATGLTVSAMGHLVQNSWDVQSGANGLYIANRTGAVFTLPSSAFPGKTFDLTALKLFALGQSSTTAPVTFTLYAYHFGNPVADTVQVTINTRAVQSVTLTDPRLVGIDTLVMRSDPLQVKYVYFIQMTFTPH